MSVHLLRYRQGPSDISSQNSSVKVAPNNFAHWALMYEDLDEDFPEQMVLHIRKADGKGCFESFTFSSSSN